MTRDRTPSLDRSPPATAEEPSSPPPRRPYRSPRLECHGRLAEVTRFGGSAILDSGGGLGEQF